MDGNLLKGRCFEEMKCRLDETCGYVEECTAVMNATTYYDLDDFRAAQNEEFDKEERGMIG